MKISLVLVSAVAVALSAPNQPSLRDIVNSLEGGTGIRVLGRDGVLRRLNAARDTVIDYVQLSADHVAEYTKRYPIEARSLYAGVDGRAVTDYSQLWAVPEDVVDITRREAKPMTSKAEPKHHPALVARACSDYACEDNDDCHPYNCAECDVFYECVGGPFGCSRFTRCDDTLG